MDSHTAIVGTPAQPWRGAWRDESDTETFAQGLAHCHAVRNATLNLHGDLGAGKTTFVRHLLRALGVSGRIKSPTYAVVEPHEALPCGLMPAGQPLHIWHFDFYRFTDPREWEDAGFRELFASPGLKLVEWPERAAGYLPPMDAHIQIQTAPMNASLPADDADTPRQVTVTPLSPTGEQLLAALGNCLAVGYAANATARGIELTDLRIKVTGDLDLHSFLGLRPGHAGFHAINAAVHLQSNATPDQLSDLHDAVIGTSPVGHTLQSAIAVRIHLA